MIRINLSLFQIEKLLKGCQFEREIMSATAGKRLATLGLADRFSGRHGRLTTIQLTEAGKIRFTAEREMRMREATDLPGCQ